MSSLIDNLDIVLDGLAKDQWHLRRVLQQAGGVVLIGASTAALEAAVHPEAPFYDFFQIDLLDRLDDLKSEATRDFAEGGLRGEGLLAGVIALINDTRSSLTAGNRTPASARFASTPGPETTDPRPDLPVTPSHPATGDHPPDLVGRPPSDRDFRQG